MSQSPAQFAVRTMRALEILTFAPTTAPRVAEALGVHSRTARRLLSQLQRDGWLSYNPRSPHVYAPTLPDLDEAMKWAERLPWNTDGCSTEIRPIMDYEAYGAGAATATTEERAAS